MIGYIKDTTKFATNNNVINCSTNKIHLSIHILLYIFLAFSSLHENPIFNTAVSVIIIVYFLFSRPNEHFYFLVGFVPFEYIVKFGSVSSYFIFLLISTIKLIVGNKNKTYRLNGIISLLFLTSLEITHEFGFITNGELLINLTIIIYFCIFILSSDKTSYNIARIIQNFCISYIVVIAQVIAGYGSFGAYLQMVDTNSDIIRFGDEARSLGGAMGIPLYSALLISILISYYVVRHKLDFKKKILILIMCIIAVIFGTLTISRAFLLTMAAWMIFFILSLFDRQRKKVFMVLLLVVVASVIAYYTYSDSINGIIGSFLYRVSKDSGFGIRGFIWQSCFDYLNSHTFGYLFGYGIGNYVKIGYKNNLLFSAMAHNLYIDIIMSIGSIGFICLTYLLNMLKSKVKNVFHTKIRLITAIPLMVFLSFGFTALSLNNLKTWIYILMLVIYAYALSIENINVKGEEVNG